jgi:AcrR family transcriptional regulator
MSTREKPPSRRDENAEKTRGAILGAARKIFARDGYADAPLEAIVKSARVTTGAVYHHFGDKKGLFRAVAEDLEGELLQKMLAGAAHEKDAWKRLTAAVRVMLELSLAPEMRQILFRDAPNVIGASEWHEIEKRYALGAMIATLDDLAKAGVIRVDNRELLALMLLGAFREAAHSVAAADDPKRLIKEAQAVIVGMLGAFRP